MNFLKNFYHYFITKSNKSIEDLESARKISKVSVDRQKERKFDTFFG